MCVRKRKSEGESVCERAKVKARVCERRKETEKVRACVRTRVFSFIV